MNNNPSDKYISFLSPFIKGYLSCFCILVVKNNTPLACNYIYLIKVLISLRLDMDLGDRFLNKIVFLFKVFCEPLYSFFILVELTEILTNSIQVPLLAHFY